MNTVNYGIIKGTKHEAPAVLEIPRGVTWKGLATMCSNDTPTHKSIPYGYCHCGCGEKAPVAERTRRAKGHTKGEPLKFIHNHHGRKRWDPVSDESLGCFKIPLSRGKFALVDTDDLEKVASYGWQYSDRETTGYAVGEERESGQHVRMHRLITGAPDGVEVDHVNRDGLDNRRSNLRLCTAEDNQRNRRMATSRSGFIGVLPRPSGRWQASISGSGKKVHLGTFDTAEEAAKARDMATIALHGEYGILNFPEDAAAIRNAIATALAAKQEGAER